MKLGGSAGRILAFLVILSEVALSKGNLVVNGNWREAPARASLGALEEHAGASVWTVPSGSTALGTWTSQGHVWLIYSKRNGSRWAGLGSNSSISQDVATVPGQHYVLQFTTVTDVEGPANSKLLVQFGGETKTFAVPAQGWRQVYNFMAKANTTTLRFTAQVKGGGGPQLGRIGLWAFDPEEEKLKAKLGEFYKSLDRAEKYPEHFAKHQEFLTDDFSWQPKEGTAQDKETYLNAVMARMERKVKVNTVVEEVEVTPEGLLVEVERREVIPGDYGKVDSNTPHFRHLWIRQGDAWKLKSAEEI